MLRSALFLPLPFVLLACASPNTDDLFTSSVGDGAGGAHATGSATAGTSGSSVTGTSATSTSAVGPSATSSESAASVGATSSVASTGSGPVLPTVSCAGQPCTPGDVCCFWQLGPGQDTCAAPGQCPDPMDQYSVLACNGPDDCPGKECCALWTSQGGWQYTKCENHCGGNELLMCGGDPSVCMGLPCKQSAILGAGYSYCGN